MLLLKKLWRSLPREGTLPPRSSLRCRRPEDPGKFVVPCSIDRDVFRNSLCDSGSSVYLMSNAITERLRIGDMKASQVPLKFVDASTITPDGLIQSLDVRVGSCLVPTDFHVIEMTKGSVMPLILGRPFIATMGAVVDLPKKRISFSNLDEKIFYDINLSNEAMQRGSCPTIDNEKKVDLPLLVVDPYAAIRDQLFPPPAPARYDDHGQPPLAGPIDPPHRSIDLHQASPVRRPTLGGHDSPDKFYSNRAAIHLPDEGNDYKINPQIIYLVAENLFYGLRSESPLDDIANFAELCNTFRSSGVPVDFMICKLFPLSLSNKARKWFK